MLSCCWGGRRWWGRVQGQCLLCCPRRALHALAGGRSGRKHHCQGPGPRRDHAGTRSAIPSQSYQGKRPSALKQGRARSSLRSSQLDGSHGLGQPRVSKAQRGKGATGGQTGSGGGLVALACEIPNCGRSRTHLSTVQERESADHRALAHGRRRGSLCTRSLWAPRERLKPFFSCYLML